jgi:hypothetical protein
VFKLELNLPLEDSRTLGKDKTIILADMTWEDYLQLTDSNSSNCRLDYFEGIISIIAPSRNHERIAQIITRTYCSNNLFNQCLLPKISAKVLCFRLIRYKKPSSGWQTA